MCGVYIVEYVAQSAVVGITLANTDKLRIMILTFKRAFHFNTRVLENIQIDW